MAGVIGGVGTQGSSLAVRHFMGGAGGSALQLENVDEESCNDSDSSNEMPRSTPIPHADLTRSVRSKSADQDDIVLDAGVKPVQMTRKGSKSSMQLTEESYEGLIAGLPRSIGHSSRDRAAEHLQLLGSYDFDPIGLDRHTGGHSVAIVAPILLRAGGYLRVGP